jgi:hypothetical protein
LLFQAWYLDDGVLVGAHADLLRALQVIQDHGPDLGLHLNLPKCEVWWPSCTPDHWRLYPAAISKSLEPGIDLLGAPLGHSTYAERYVGKRVTKIKGMLDKVADINDSHIELTLIRACLGFPKFAFALRTCAPVKISGAISSFDASIQQALGNILEDRCVSEQVHLQTSLPVSKGGLGIQSAAMVAAPAFLASVSSSLSIQRTLVDDATVVPGPEFTRCLEDLNRVLEDTKDSFAGLESRITGQVEEVGGAQEDDQPEVLPVTLAVLEAQARAQNYLSTMVNKRAFAKLFHELAPVGQARLLSLRQPYAGTWLLIPPIKAVGLRMPSKTFRACIRYRLGVAIYPVPSNGQARKCPCCTSGILDPLGTHATICPGETGTIQRHEDIKRQVHKFIQQASYPNTVMEPVHLLGTSGQRPADILIPNWAAGKGAAIDVAVVSPVADSMVVWAAQHGGSTGRKKEKSKIHQYAIDCRAQDLQFIPLVLESFGGFAPLGMAFLKTVAKRYAHYKDMTVAEATARIFQRISYVSQLALGNSIVHRMPYYDPY